MNNQRRTFVAKNIKTGFHSIWNVIPGDYKPEKNRFLEPLTVNQLARWKNLRDVITTLEAVGPLIPFDVYPQEKRVMSIEDALQIAKARGIGHESQGFTVNDPHFLRIQLMLEGFVPSYPSKTSIEKDVERFGLIESDAASDLEKWAEEDKACRVVVEPLCDVVSIRNRASQLLRIIANLQDESNEHVLESSGFQHIRRDKHKVIGKQYRNSYFVLPLKHNPAVDMTLNFSTKWFRNVFGYMTINPLDSRIREMRPHGNETALGSVRNVANLTSSILTGNAAPLINHNKRYEDEDTWLYTGVEDSLSQREEAMAYIGGYEHMFSNLTTKDGTPIGWDISSPSPFENEPKPVFLFHTLAGALFGSIFYRYGTTAAICKNCQNGFMAKTKGKQREFCSNSCRTQNYMKGK